MNRRSAGFRGGFGDAIQRRGAENTEGSAEKTVRTGSDDIDNDGEGGAWPLGACPWSSPRSSLRLSLRSLRLCVESHPDVGWGPEAGFAILMRWPGAKIR